MKENNIDAESSNTPFTAQKGTSRLAFSDLFKFFPNWIYCLKNFVRLCACLCVLRLHLWDGVSVSECVCVCVCVLSVCVCGILINTSFLVPCLCLSAYRSKGFNRTCCFCFVVSMMQRAQGGSRWSIYRMRLPAPFAKQSDKRPKSKVIWKDCRPAGCVFQ